jgi:hypothetical protein
MSVSHSNTVATLNDNPSGIYYDEDPFGPVDQGQGYLNRDRAKYFFSARQKEVFSIDTENLEIDSEFLFTSDP